MKVAVILAGCGNQDGSELRETILSMLALDQQGIEWQCFAPQSSFTSISHLTGEPTGTRDGFIEASRIARGEIRPLNELNPIEYDALFLPGGYAVANMLTTYAEDGASFHILPELEKVLHAMHANKLPIVALCMAPLILAKAFAKKKRLQLTFGPGDFMADVVQEMGHDWVKCKGDEIAIDPVNRVITTPAYVLSDLRLKDLYSACTQIVDQLKKFWSQS